MTDSFVHEERRRRTLAVVRTVALLLGAAAVIVFGNRGTRLARMSTLAARVALGEKSPEAVTEIERAASPEIYYHVVLGGVPLGWTLHLRCEWQDPDGRIALCNQYATRFVYKSMWPTHCRQRFHPTSLAGEWRVRLLLDSRVLSSSTFVLK
jgi:hypothetical protein